MRSCEVQKILCRLWLFENTVCKNTLVMDGNCIQHVLIN